VGESTDGGGAGTDAGNGGSFSPITTQDELNRILAAEKRRIRAQYADYDELKSKVAAAEQSAKTTEEQTNERLAKLESDLSKSQAAALRYRIAAKHKISDEDAELFLLGTDEETLEKQAKRLAEAASTQKQKNAVVPKEGATTNGGGEDELRNFTKNLFSPEGADT
jgi:peptidoglycan hydrolase CwlO-like protein